MIKKILFVLLLCAIVAPVWADDAMVLPPGVLRITLAPFYAFTTGEWDEDGKYTAYGDGEGAMKMFNIGAALEFGVVNWLTLAVQWAPGYTVWSEIDSSLPIGKPTVNGPWDILLGAKAQIVGDQGFVQNEMIRFALAAGIKLPMPDPDWEEEVTNFMADDPFIASRPDKHALGLGGRAYLDIVFHKAFYLNFYSEFIGFLNADQKSLMSSTTEQEVSNGYNLTLETEPTLLLPLAEGTILNVGLPLTMKIFPDQEIDGAVSTNKAGYTLSVTPSVSIMLLKIFLPMELEVSYGIPLMGKNDYATQSLIFKVKPFIKFGK